MDLSGFLTPGAWLSALEIFGLLLFSMALDTVRVIFVVRGKKLISWILGFVSSLTITVALGWVLVKMDNPINVIGYACGMATGSVLGMVIDDKMAFGHIQITIVSPHFGTALVNRLRSSGFAVTEIPGRGKDGMVSMLYCDVLRRDLDQTEKLIREIDPSAFITAEDIRPIRHGFWGK